MNTIFMKSENSKTSKPHVLISKLTNKLDLRIGEKIIALSNLSIYYTWKNIKSSYKNKFKISAPTWNDEFELPDGSYSVSDIQDYFEYILKKQEENTNYSLKLLTSETMKLLRSTKNKITTDKLIIKLLGSSKNKITKDKLNTLILKSMITMGKRIC